MSRAFRNRFCELQFDDLPDEELEEILHQRCSIPPSYSKKLILVMKDLQRRRQGTQVFAGKHGFITLRDLFRWAERDANGYEELAVNGYMLLAERLRMEEERETILTVLQQQLRVKLEPPTMYDCASAELQEVYQRLLGMLDGELGQTYRVVWTKSMKRLFTLVYCCLRNREPVLLVGETGCGKTTICQLLAAAMEQPLEIINCHQHTETADFLGSLRPVRGREMLENRLKLALREYLTENSEVIEDQTLDSMVERFRELAATAMEDQAVDGIRAMISRHASLFEWQDGPLVQCMKSGDMLLIDEISLAEDSVLERLNSVLEPERKLLLAEKGGSSVDEIQAHVSFRILATMNPGGDFGKKELSPAARNRFTEIWVPSIGDDEELQQILQARLTSRYCSYGIPILRFLKWLESHPAAKFVLSLRDYLSWVDFLNGLPDIVPTYAGYVHGACLVVLDGLETISGVPATIAESIRKSAWKLLLDLIPGEEDREAAAAAFSEGLSSQETAKKCGDHFGTHPFYIPLGSEKCVLSSKYSFASGTTSKNVLRLLRGLQIRKPLLLEGAPGVGKTSLVEALAKASGHNIVRINLSEQTDMIDLLGSDLPVEDGVAGAFRWSDGIFLKALKAGDWVLLDELNLASQSVLEGLNAVLDHRATVYLPELGMSFACPASFRIFGCQNPTSQGGGRKGLPKSFLNRFTRVFVEPFSPDDLIFITAHAYPDIPQDTLTKMIEFNSAVYQATMVRHLFASTGSPWEFNLRDVFRWCALIESTGSPPAAFVDMLYLRRMRTKRDQQCIVRIFEDVFQEPPIVQPLPPYNITPYELRIGEWSCDRRRNHPSKEWTMMLRKEDLRPLDSMMACVKMNWLSILIGPSGCGKTSCVKTLAALCGRKLRQFWMNSSIDTTELLGGFQQIDLSRIRRNVLEDISCMTKDVMQLLLISPLPLSSSSSTTLIAHANQARDLAQQLSITQSQLHSEAQHALFEEADQRRLLSLLDALEKAFTLLSADTTAELRSRVAKSRETMARYNGMDAASVSGRFEWINGVIVQAIESGDWVLIDNVNFCSPSVLDRLNPLLEEGATSFEINERGLVDGSVKSVRRHPDFRLFMAMDPANGEISRAMRNRGIEICWLGDHVCADDWTMMLNAAGYCGPTLPDRMVQAHISLMRAVHANEADVRPLLLWATLMMAMLKRGHDLRSSMCEPLTHVYFADSGADIVKRMLQSPALELLGPCLWPVLPDRLCLEDSLGMSCLKSVETLSYFVLTALQNTCSSEETENIGCWTSAADLSSYMFGTHPGDTGILDTPREEVLRRLSFAIPCFLLDVSPGVHQRNLAMLQGFQKVLPKDKGVSVVCAIIHQLLDCSVYQHTVESWKTEAEYCRIPQPLDLRLADDDKPHIAHQNLVSALSLLARRLWYKRAEKDALQRVSVQFEDLSLLEQSFALSIGNRRVEAASDLVKIAFPFLHHLNEWAIGVLSSAAQPTSQELDVLSQLLWHRDAFWSALAERMSDSSAVGWLWYDLSALLNSLPSAMLEGLQEASPDVLARFKLACQESGLIPRISELWSNGGHPRIARNVHIRQTMSYLEDSDLQLSKYCSMVSSTRSVQIRARKVILDAITTVRAADVTGAEDVASLTDTIRKTVEGVTAAARPAAALAAVTTAGEEEASQHARFQNHERALVPLDEIRLLEDIGTFVTENFFRSHLDSSGKIEATLQKLCCAVVQKTFLPLHSVASINELLCLNEARDDARNDRRLELLTDAQLQWHRSLWTCSLNSRFADTPLYQGAALLAGDGCSRVGFSQLHSLSDVPLRDVNEKEEQLRQWKKFFHNLPAHDADSMDWQRLHDSARRIYGALGGDVQDMQVTQNAAIVAALRVLSGKAREDSDLRKFLHQTCIVAEKWLLTGDESSSSAARGLLWIGYGLLSFEEVRPSTEIDPTSRVVVAVAGLRARCAQLRDELEVFELSEKVHRGRSTNRRIDEIREELQERERECCEMEKLVTPRPDPPIFDSLYREISRFSASFGVNRVSMIVSKLSKQLLSRETDSNEAEMTLQEETSWQMQAQNLLEELDSRYHGYQDITHPVALAIMHVKYGMRLLACQVDGAQTPVLGVYENIVRVLCRLPASSIRQQVQSLLKQQKMKVVLGGSQSSKLQSSFFRTLLWLSHNLLSLHGCNQPLDATLVDELFNVFLATWKANEAARKKKEAEAESLYKHRATQRATLDEDAEEEALYTRMFPDFSQEFADLEDIEEVDLEVISSDITEESGEEASVVEFEPSIGENEIAMLFDLHQRLFASANDYPPLTDSDLRTSMRLSYETAGALSAQLNKSMSFHINHATAASHASAAERLSEALRTSREIEAKDCFSIYTDPQVNEAKLLLPLMDRFQERLIGLLQQWPDHSVLQQLLKIIERILAIPITSPLMKFITALELLLRRAHEWDSYASREVSVKENIHEIGLLVARWRKLELTSWPEILNVRSKRMAEKSHVWWFHLYTNLINITEEDCQERICELVKVVNDFLRLSSAGEYTTRLSMLRSFYGQISKLKLTEEKSDSPSTSVWKRLQAVLYNMWQYYLQFKPAVDSLCENGRAPIEKELKEFVKIARWDKLEYYSLKEVAEKSRRKISKFAKKLESVLQQPVASVLFHKMESSTAVVNRPRKPFIMNSLHKISAPITRWRSVPTALQKKLGLKNDTGDRPKCPSPETIHRRMLSLLKQDVLGPLRTILLEGCFSEMDQFSTQIVEELIRLRDGNAKRTEKHRSLVDLLKSLKLRGLSHHVRVREADQHDMSLLLQRCPPFKPQHITDDAANSCWSSVERYFYSCISRMQMARELTTTASKDLTRREVNTSIGFCEHLLAIALRNRSQILRLTHSLRSCMRIRELANALGSVTEDDKNIQLLAADQESAITAIKKMRVVVYETFLYILQISTFWNMHVDKEKVITTEVYQWYRSQPKDCPDEHIVSLQTLNVHYSKGKKLLEALLVVADILKTRSAAEDCYTPVDTTYAVYQQADERLLVLRTKIETCLSMLREASTISAARHLEPSALDVWAVHYRSMIARMQITVQKMRSAASSFNAAVITTNATEGVANSAIAEADSAALMREGYLPSVESGLAVLTENCCADNFEELFRESVEGIKQFLLSDTESSVHVGCSLLLMQVGHIFDVYKAGLDEVLAVLLQYERAVLKLLYILLGVFTTLYREGLCLSAEEQEQQSDRTEEGSGTGMGEGEGMNDVSKEIDDEEDLLRPNELQGPEPDREDLEEEEEGKEMEGDFEGNMYDQEKEKEDNKDSDSEGDNENEQDEPDRQMGNVDEENEEVVDEQLWDDKEDPKDQPEKESESSAPGNTEEIHDEFAAKDEEGSEDEDQQREKPQQKEEGPETEKEEEREEEGDVDDQEDDGEMRDIGEEENALGKELKEEEEFELPDDMDMNDDGKDDDMVDGAWVSCLHVAFDSNAASCRYEDGDG